MGLDPSIVWDFAGEVVGRLTPTVRSVPATVTRVDPDGTVWATTGDGMEAPAASASAGVEPGDVVDVEWSGATMRITGNASDPAPSGRMVARVRQLAQEAKSIADATGQHFWHDDNGAHVSSEEGNPTGAQNTVWNSLGMLFRRGANNLLAIVTGSDPGMDVYDGQGNADANVIASYRGSGVRLGYEGGAHMVQTDSATTFVGDDGETVTAEITTETIDGTPFAMLELAQLSDIRAADGNLSLNTTGADDTDNPGVIELEASPHDGSSPRRTVVRLDNRAEFDTSGYANGVVEFTTYDDYGDSATVSIDAGEVIADGVSAGTITGQTSVNSLGTITAAGVIRASGGEVRLYATSSYIYLRDDNGIGWRFSKSGAHIHCCTDGTNWVTVI